MATMNDSYDEAVANVIRRGYVDYVGNDRGNRWFQLHTADPTDVGDHRVTGVPRVPVALNEIQTLTITGSPTGGSFTLTYDGQTTDSISFDATAADVQAALEALSNIGPGNVICDGGPLPDNEVTIEFVRDLGQQSLSLITSTDSLTGGTDPATSIVETVAGMDLLGTYTDDAGSGGRIAENSAVIELTPAATASETATHASLWINETGTSSAEMVISEQLVAPVPYSAGQPVEIAAGGLGIFGAGAGA